MFYLCRLRRPIGTLLIELLCFLKTFVPKVTVLLCSVGNVLAVKYTDAEMFKGNWLCDNHNHNGLYLHVEYHNGLYYMMNITMVCTT